jgi:hypothetical protein
MAIIFAIGVPIWQSATGFGLSASEFSQDGNQTLRAAGYAFSIWGLIYLGLVGYGIYQFLAIPSAYPVLQTVSWPAIVAMFGCGLWILASALNLKLASMVIIVGSAVALTLSLVEAASLTTWWNTAFVRWPLGLLAGWLTIASAINVLTVFTAWEVINPATATGFAIGGIVTVIAVSVYVTQIRNLKIFAVPIAWGLVAVFVAERSSSLAIALVALAGAILLVGVAMLDLWQSRTSTQWQAATLKAKGL